MGGWQRMLMIVSWCMMSSQGLAGDVAPALPVVEELNWRALALQCQQLLDAADRTGSILPTDTVRRLRALVDRKPDDPDAACRAVQELLDPYCLLAVEINAESRVKATRGPAALVLQRNRQSIVLIKIHNEGGVTHELRLSGPELVQGEKQDGGRWLRATVLSEEPRTQSLSGQRLEYRLLGLTPSEAGKREATFQLDVGQGTQDLGFRSEVPILFTIKQPKPKRQS